jgi:hypothetical protein
MINFKICAKGSKKYDEIVYPKVKISKLEFNKAVEAANFCPSLSPSV